MVAHAEDSGSDSGIDGRAASVTATFATSGQLDDVKRYYVASFPAYNFRETCCATATDIALEGSTATAWVDVTIRKGAPHYQGHNTPAPHDVPDGDDVFVVVDARPAP